MKLELQRQTWNHMNLIMRVNMKTTENHIAEFNEILDFLKGDIRDLIESNKKNTSDYRSNAISAREFHQTKITNNLTLDALLKVRQKTKTKIQHYIQTKFLLSDDFEYKLKTMTDIELKDFGESVLLEYFDCKARQEMITKLKTYRDNFIKFNR